jgi:signal transduction histidine kinase
MTITLPQSNSNIGTVYVVDDRSDVEAAQALYHVLQHANFSVHSITLSKRLIETLRNERPDIVLLVSAGLGSLKLCQQLKQDDDSPLVIILLNDSPTAKWAGYDAGVDDFLVHPFKPHELVARLRLAMRNRGQRARLVSSNRGLEQQLAERNAELERTLLRSQELTVLKDNIVSTVSHELRTPLLQVKSSLSMLGEDLKSSAESTTKLLHYASTAAARLESSVNNITQLAAALNLKHEPFVLGDALSQAQRQLRRMWESSQGVDRIRPLLPDTLPPVMGDRTAIAQVLQQLIDNGLKFSPGGGYVDVSAVVGAQGVTLTVRDYGIGIPKDQLEKIFQAFYQVNGGSTRQFGGTGVGLAIVKLILDGMRVQCEVASTLGRGSTFSFVLPIATR